MLGLKLGNGVSKRPTTQDTLVIAAHVRVTLEVAIDGMYRIYS